MLLINETLALPLEVYGLAGRFLLDLVACFVVVRLIYYPQQPEKEYLFTFFMFNALVFFICYLMTNVQLDLGFGFGLFALFSILRYRTITLPIKEMTYLFAVITLAVIHALKSPVISFPVLAAIDLIVISIIFYLDKIWLPGQTATQEIVYENVDFINANVRDKMLDDLRQRTGLDILKAEVISTNFLNDTIKLKIYYKPK